MVCSKSVEGCATAFSFYAEPVDVTTGTKSALRFVQFNRQFGQRRIEVRHQAIIGDLEDWRLLILVNRDDHLGILHAGEMLDRAGNADRDVKLGRENPAGLSDLPVV